MEKTKTYCDRCKQEMKMPVYPYSKFTVIKGVTFFGSDPYAYVNKNITLCKKCNEQFTDWLKEKSVPHE